MICRDCGVGCIKKSGVGEPAQAPVTIMGGLSHSAWGKSMLLAIFAVAPGGSWRGCDVVTQEIFIQIAWEARPGRGVRGYV
jgi:hypothetical protein